MTDSIIGKVVATRWVGRSYYGNPSYDVTIDTGTEVRTYRTSSNAVLAYGIENSDYRETAHEFFLTKAGRISYARVSARVETWADGLGVWHASVPLTSSPRRDANRARAAIRAELDARGVDPSYRLSVTRERITAHGTAIYSEK